MRFGEIFTFIVNVREIAKDCEELRRDTESRSPHEWPEAYKAKAESYWGEPVYVATPLTLF